MSYPYSDTALIVIDVQESFRHRPYWSETDVRAFLERRTELVLENRFARILTVDACLNSALQEVTI